MTGTDVTRPGSHTFASQPERLAVAFTRLLRSRGVEVPAGASLVYAEALSAVGLSSQGSVYWAGRATLLGRPEDAPAYDRAFSTFFLRRPSLRRAGADVYPRPISLLVDAGGTEVAEGEGGAEDSAREGDGDEVRLRYSRAEALRTKDFAMCSAEELAELARLMAAVRVGGPVRRSMRYRPAPRSGCQPDLPGTVRRALRAGGEPVHRAWRAPGPRPRRIVVLCDVSGSMEPYARLLMRFLHLVVSGRAQVEAFTVGTRLTRVTRELSLHDADVALARVAGAVVDWSSGTRLGDGLREFNDRWGTRGLARGAAVVVFSDGWDQGEPEVITNEMGRLSRVAHKIVWVNPLKASPGYAPLARGMAAALPYVDEFVDGHCLASLEALAGLVSR